MRPAPFYVWTRYEVAGAKPLLHSTYQSLRTRLRRSPSFELALWRERNPNPKSDRRGNDEDCAEATMVRFFRPIAPAVRPGFDIDGDRLVGQPRSMSRAISPAVAYRSSGLSAIALRTIASSARARRRGLTRSQELPFASPLDEAPRLASLPISAVR